MFMDDFDRKRFMKYDSGRDNPLNYYHEAYQTAVNRWFGAFLFVMWNIFIFWNVFPVNPNRPVWGTILVGCVIGVAVNGAFALLMLILYNIKPVFSVIWEAITDFFDWMNGH